MKLNNFFNLNEEISNPIFSSSTSGATITNLGDKRDRIKSLASGLTLVKDEPNLLEVKSDFDNWTNNTNSVMYKFWVNFNKEFPQQNKQNTISLSGLSGTNTTGTSTSGSNFAADLLKSVVSEEIKRITKMITKR